MSRSQRGFTLVEMLGVIMILGLIVAFSVPPLMKLRKTHELKGARDNIISQIQMARARAISTGVDQPIHFYTGTYGYDYHLHVPGMPTSSLPGWRLPTGVTYQWPMGSDMNVTMKKNGRADAALIIPIRNAAGAADTVTVLSSGLVISQ